MMGGVLCAPPPPPGCDEPKKPGLDRVKGLFIIMRGGRKVESVGVIYFSARKRGVHKILDRYREGGSHIFECNYFSYMLRLCFNCIAQ